MGWSCAQAAGFTQTAISEFCVAETGMSNGFKMKNAECFIEWSRREHSDGAITGSVMKIIANTTQRVGSIRIEGDGKITTAPKMIKSLKVYTLKICEGTSEQETFWSVTKLGEPTEDNLWKAVAHYAKQLETGGVNHHVSRSLGHIPYPTAARIHDLMTGAVVAQWKAGTFQVW